MPDKETIRRAQKDAAQGKSPSTQAGEFVREEIHHVREGKHGARSPKQAIAIGLSKARRAGVKLPAAGAGTSGNTRRRAQRDLAASRKSPRTSARRSRATRPRSNASRAAPHPGPALARRPAPRHGGAVRRAGARPPEGLPHQGHRRTARAARKAARTRKSR